MELFVFLGHEEEASTQGGGGRSDDASSEGVINIFFYGLSLRLVIQVIQLARQYSCPREKVDGAIIKVVALSFLKDPVPGRGTQGAMGKRSGGLWGWEGQHYLDTI